jgi:hypothetical protein
MGSLVILVMGCGSDSQSSAGAGGNSFAAGGDTAVGARLGSGGNSPAAAGTASTGGTQGSFVKVAVTAINAGALHVCALLNDGAQCWGRNADGQLGNVSR